MNRQAASFLISSILFLGLATPVKSASQSSGVIERIERTGVLRVAVREDAPPFGYLGSSGNLQGYCLDFFSLLQKQLIKQLQRNTLTIKLFKSSPNSRFSLVENNSVDLECGPNTISEDVSEEINFSQSFFITGTQFLVRQENKDSIDFEQDLAGVRLGVVSNTTNARYIAERYPAAILKRFSGVTAKTRGIEAVKQGRIDAMVSDGILLRAAAQRRQLSATKYPLIPEEPLTCDHYGMLIKSEDPQWQDFVNSVISSPEAEQLQNTWFGRLLNYVQTTIDFCQ